MEVSGTACRRCWPYFFVGCDFNYNLQKTSRRARHRKNHKFKKSIDDCKLLRYNNYISNLERIQHYIEQTLKIKGL